MRNIRNLLETKTIRKMSLLQKVLLMLRRTVQRQEAWLRSLNNVDMKKNLRRSLPRGGKKREKIFYHYQFH